MSEIKTKHEHGVETFFAYFRGVLIDEFENRKDAEEAIDRLQQSFNGVKK